MTTSTEHNAVAGVETSTPVAILLPDEAALRRDLEKGNFLSGVDRGRWRLLSVNFPIVIITVSAPARQHGPMEFAFRFDASGYPHQAPTAQPWDVGLNAPLVHTRWPGGTGRVATVFNPTWMPPKPGDQHALYLPCDRLALPGHDPWRQEHASMIWQADWDITRYLREIHGLLDTADYTGIRVPGA